MENNKILEGNKLIAEFMNAEFVNDAPEHYPNGYYMWAGPFEPDYSQLEDFEFHSSWDWLMAIVERINNIKIKDYDTKLYIYIKINVIYL